MNITPGPWIRDGAFVYALQHHGWKKGIETFENRFYLSVQSGRGISDDEIITNARAIAEVPNLIEALQTFLDLCPRMSDNDPIGPSLAEQCRHTKAILKRIEST